MEDYQINNATRRSPGGRKYLEFKTTFHNSQAKKGDDEFWSEGFSEYHVKDIIDTCNKTGMPAEVEIKLKTKTNEILTTYKFTILPTLMTHNMTSYQNSTIMSYYSSPELIRKQTLLEAKKDKKGFDSLVKEHEEIVKEYVRIELVDLYFRLLRGNTVPYSTLEYIKNLSIVREKYDLEQFELEDIQTIKLSETDDKKPFESLLYDFAKTYATAMKDEKKLAIVYGYYTNFVGLEKPQTEAEIEAYAKKLAALSDFRKRTERTYGFMDEYKKKKERPYLRTESLIPIGNGEDPSGYQPS